MQSKKLKQVFTWFGVGALCTVCLQPALAAMAEAGESARPDAQAARLETTHRARDRRPTVAFFISTETEDDSWGVPLIQYARAAANDLDIDLEIHHLRIGRALLREAAMKRIESEKPLDYALMINHRGGAVDMLKLFEKHQVHVYLFNSGLTDEEHRALGAPGEKLKYWIGELTPDDEEAGYALAKNLIESAKQRNTDPDTDINVVAVTGSYANPVAIARMEGAKRAVNEEPRARLLQTVSARWNTAVAAEKFKWLRERYNDIDVVWAANDLIALGIMSETRASDEHVIGGMDWSQEVIDPIERGAITSSMGGHFVDVAYALADIDHHFSCVASGRQCNYGIRHSTLSIMTRDQVASLPALVGEQNIEALDFSTLRRPEQDNLGQREVSIDAFMATQARGN